MLQILKNGSTRMHMSNDGKLGIGTASPNAPLEVNGGVGMTGGWGRSLVLRHNFPTIVWQSEYSTDAYAGIGYDNTTGMHFMVNSPTIDVFASGNTSAMFIKDDKNIGIGTTSPSKPLHLKRTSGWATMRLEGASDSGGELEFYKGSTKAGGIFFNNSNALIIRCSNTQRMKIHDSGCIDLGADADRSLGTNITTTVTSGSAGSGFWMSTGNSSATSTKLTSYQNGSVGEFKINQGSGVNGGSILFSINDAEKNFREVLL